MVIERRGQLRQVAILTLGCKLNQADSDALARRFRLAGCAVGEDIAGADAIIVNSCTVTHVADRKARQLVRQARRGAPGATVVLTGCYVDSAGGRPAIEAGADLAIPNRDKGQIVDLVFSKRTGETPDAGAAGERPALRGLRSRAFIKIQEGCNDVCSFCIVPRVRGREDSRTVDDILEEAAAHEAAGAQEIVLTGTQLGHYGRDRGWEPGPRLLLEQLLLRTTVPRIRISSLQPQDLHPALLELWADKRLCPHFHVPLQSGSDSVLRRMRRRYGARRYREALDLVRKQVPGASVTTDVIAGFPGETEEDFAETVALCEEAGFSWMHVFPYSLRRGTSAALLDGHLPSEVKRRRVDELIGIARQGGARFRRGLLGASHEVLWEERVPDGEWLGLTANYVRTRVSTDDDLANTISTVKLLALRGDIVDAERLPIAVAGRP
ncbi:MAG: tRNA (N(6)-L-threonylcarbamoyladenosine(37)-C(2))-methylthiotransferase MtaB [Dehalococcoidia bacterium]|nr:tRNA (N(6)-L-threonylcarbamoyladenosine(37)-C(2))-methylthiotransferase MtaB [Dehalococcoidia bacterium]